MKKLIALLLLSTSPVAFAYIDPGSGMLLIQGLIAAIAGILAFLTKPMEKIKTIWRRMRGDRDA